MFDLAATVTWAPEEAAAAFAALPERLVALADRIALLREDYVAHAADDLNPTEKGRDLLLTAPEVCLAALAPFGSATR